MDREDEALVFMGSVMIWIVGGTKLLTILLGAIPGEPDVWLASGSAFVAAVGPPYSPSVLGILDASGLWVCGGRLSDAAKAVVRWQ